MIVDADAASRQRVRELLRRESDIRVIKECRDLPAARRAAARLKPQLLFLEIRLPGGDGLALLEHKNGATPAAIVITTTEKDARRAFDLHIVDYLLKPLSPARFAKALLKARARISKRPVRNDHLTIKHQRRWILVRHKDISSITTARGKLEIKTDEQTYRIRERLETVHAQLPPAKFIRISRSALVNLDRVAHVRPLTHGDAEIELASTDRLRLSRRFRSGAKALLQSR